MTQPTQQPVVVFGGEVVTMNSAGEVLRDGAVAFDGDRIVAVGDSAEILRRWPDAQTLDATGCVITPGLINAHQHFTGDPLVKSRIPDRISSQQAIYDWAVPAHDAHTSQDEELSATLCAAECALRGVTLALEAGTVANPQAVARGIDRVGIRARLGIWGSDTPGLPLAGSVAEVVACQRELLDAFPSGPGNLIEGWVCLVGHDLASSELLVAAAELARNARCGMTMHLSPTPADAQYWLETTGKRPLVHFEELGILGRHLLLGHAVWLDDREVDILLDTQTAAAFCPWAYLRLGQGVSQGGRHFDIWRRGGRVALGADSHNAADSIDMLRVAAVCAGLWRDQSMDAEVFGAEHALELLTSAAARALNLDHAANDENNQPIGSLEPGFQADLVVYDTADIAWNPRGDAALQLIWGSVGHTVRDVFVAGRQIVNRGELTQLNYEELRTEVADRQAALLKRARLGG